VGSGSTSCFAPSNTWDGRKRVVSETYWTVGAVRIRVGGEFACLRATASVERSLGLDIEAKTLCLPNRQDNGIR
jgi:hypothetical protein